MTLPIYTLQAYDRIIIHHNLSTFFILTVGALFFILFEFVFRLLRSYLISYQSNKSGHSEYINAIKNFVKLQPEKLIKMSLAEKNEIISESSKTNDFIHKQLYIVSVDIIFLFLFLTVIAILSLKLAIVMILILCTFTAISVIFNIKAIKQYHIRSKSDNHRLDGIIDVLRSNFVAKTYGNELLLLQKHDVIERKSVMNTYQLSFCISKIYNFSTFTTQILIVSTLVIGASQVISGNLTFGTLIATILIAGRLTNPIKEVLTIWFKAGYFLKSRKKLNDFYQGKQRPHLSGSIKKRYNNILDIQDVGIKEGIKSNQFSFKSLNLTLKLGQLAVITGVSEHQRMLLRHMLTGMKHPDTGNIFVMGNPVYKLTSDQYYKMIGYITVDEEFINGTIKENITSGRDIPDEEIEELCQLLSIKNDIIQLEHGFQTNINPSTLKELSMSLRAKILITRAYIYRPRLVIIDTDEEYIDHSLYQSIFLFIKKICKNTAILIITNDNNFKILSDYYYDINKCIFNDYDINKIDRIGYLDHESK